MLHSFLLLLGLSNPYFNHGDWICFQVDSEFNTNEVVLMVEKVGKKYYLLKFSDEPTSLSIEKHIDFVDEYFHVCDKDELNKNEITKNKQR